MIGSFRRLTFQLTPLLDLLLIVIFAQFMEVRETVEREEQESSAQIDRLSGELENKGNELTAFETKLVEAQQALKAAEQNSASQRERLEAKDVQQRTEIIELTESLKLARQQRDLVGELLTELFRIPDEVVDQVLSQQFEDPAGQPDQRIEELKESFRNLADQRADEMIMHLLTYEELQKRSDIWQLYLTEDGRVQLSAGNETRQFRFSTAEEFEEVLFDLYKNLPQPKGLVIILFSFGDAQRVLRRAVQEGLPKVTDRMRADSNGRTRFEYANLGFRPESIPSDEP